MVVCLLREIVSLPGGAFFDSVVPAARVAPLPTVTGAITCTYDGANKFRTIIEDEAFIGSDSQLVAPVTVGKGATIGAGTTLTRNAPAGKLTISRPKQLTIENWQRPVKVKK